MTNTRKLIAAVLTAAALSASSMFLVMDSATADPVTATAQPVVAQPTAPALSLREMAFLATIGNRPGLRVKASDASWLYLGSYVCDSSRQGHSMFAIINKLATSDWSLTSGDAGWIFGASTAAFCPEHNPFVTSGKVVI